MRLFTHRVSRESLRRAQAGDLIQADEHNKLLHNIEDLYYRAEEGLPLRNVEIFERGDHPRPLDYFDNTFWGEDKGVLFRSGDVGRTWREVCQVEAGVKIERLIPTADGEVIAATPFTLWKSTGWASPTITWRKVLENPTRSYFHPWSIKGGLSGKKFIVTHYSGSGPETPDRADSRFGWISVDAGSAFKQVWDSDENWTPERAKLTHIHAAEYDEWEDRFFITEGHEYDMTGVYESTDDGASWHRIPYSRLDYQTDPFNSPTVIAATDKGVVFGTDDPTNGIIVLPRGERELRRAYSRRGVTNAQLFGYAHMGARDPRTGQVLTVWEMGATANYIGAQIIASDGIVAAPVWEDTNPARRLWRRIVIDDQGHLLAWEQTQNHTLRAFFPGVGTVPAHMYDTGRVFGGKVEGEDGTVAVGARAAAVGNGAVAIGQATTNGGEGRRAPVAVGKNAVAEFDGVAVGADALAQKRDGGVAPGTTAVGAGAKAASRAGEVTAVGAKALAEGDFATAVGFDAQVKNVRGTALGRRASVGANRGTAVGADSQCGPEVGATALGAYAYARHRDSVAVGDGVVTSAASQVAVGSRHIDLGPVAAPPEAPGKGARLFVVEEDGATVLKCVLAGGSVVTLGGTPTA